MPTFIQSFSRRLASRLAVQNELKHCAQNLRYQRLKVIRPYAEEIFSFVIHEPDRDSHNTEVVHYEIIAFVFSITVD